MICGIQIAEVAVSRSIPWAHLSGLMIARLVIGPLLAFAVLTLFGVDDLSKLILTILAGMPVGLSTVIFAKKYGADADFTALAIIVSTFLALLTTPILLYGFSQIG
jgi:predicted permease